MNPNKFEEARRRILPLCPDHRDKQKGKSCLACRIEELEKLEKKVRNLAIELCPDYPEIETCAIWECLWAIYSSLKGAEQACQDWADLAKWKGITIDDWNQFKKERPENVQTL